MDTRITRAIQCFSVELEKIGTRQKSSCALVDNSIEFIARLPRDNVPNRATLASSDLSIRPQRIRAFLRCRCPQLVPILTTYPA
jgi:hypothetical protein